jgi:Flp pilus assembly protein TadB
MTNRGKIAVGGVAVGLLLWWLTSFWIAVLVIVGVPAVAYLALDPSQRRRLRRVSRKEIGR